MRINITFKNFEPSDHLRKYTERRFEKLVRYMGRRVECTELLITLSIEKFRHKAEVTCVSNHLHLSAFEESEEMYSTVDLVLDKLEIQLKKVREKNRDERRQQDHTYAEIIHSGKYERIIVSTDYYEPKPMDVEEAAEQLENLKYEFLVFINAETDRVNVIYRRKDDGFAIIDPGQV